ncbi:MAG: hypothetical protein ACKVON_00870 [Beijerinckiaceae bacterium]
MKMKFFIFAFAAAVAAPAIASHTITNTGKSGERILVTDMFWQGPDCAGVAISSYQLVSAPQNGTVTQRSVREKLNSAKLNISPPARCEGKEIPISYVSYQSKKGFKGSDSFTVRWTSATGETREKSYTVTIQ